MNSYRSERLPPISTLVLGSTTVEVSDASSLASSISPGAPLFPTNQHFFEFTSAGRATGVCVGPEPEKRSLKKRENHKEVERRRRNIINEGYQNLRNALASLESLSLPLLLTEMGDGLNIEGNGNCNGNGNGDDRGDGNTHANGEQKRNSKKRLCLNSEIIQKLPKGRLLEIAADSLLILRDALTRK